MTFEIRDQTNKDRLATELNSKIFQNFLDDYPM